QPQDAVKEGTLKEDERHDRPVNKDALAMLGILTREEYQTLKTLTVEISEVVKEALAKRGIDLYDIKLEFGRDENNQIILIDEISGGNMRAYKDGQYIEPLVLTEMIVGE